MDIIESFKFIFFIFQASGILPFRLERKPNGRCAFSESAQRFLYTKILFAVFVLMGAYIEFYTISVNINLFPELSTKLVFIVSSTCMALSNFTVFVLVIKENKAFLMWLNKLNDLFSNVTEKVLKVVKWHFGLSVTGTLLWIVISYAAQIYLRLRAASNKLVATSTSEFLLMMLYYFIVWEIKIYLQLFLMFVILIRGYYEEIQQEFKNRFYENHKRFWLNYFRRLRAQNSEVKDLLDFLHVAFIPTVALMLLWTICTVLFNMTVAAKIGIPAVIQIFWMVYLLSDTFLTVFECHLAESAAKKTAHFVHQRLIDSDDRDLKREVEILSLQLQHENFEFNALGFCKINNKMLYSMMGWLTSNTVILLQFQNDWKNSC